MLSCGQSGMWSLDNQTGMWSLGNPDWNVEYGQPDWNVESGRSDWNVQSRKTDWNMRMVHIHLRKLLWVYCPGHEGVKGNDRADRLADKAA